MINASVGALEASSVVFEDEVLVRVVYIAMFLSKEILATSS